MVVDLSEIKGKQKENELETISLKCFNKMNRKDEYCFELNDERVTDDVEYFFYENDVKENEQEKRIDKAKHIKVFKKSKFVLTGKLILNLVECHLEDNFDYCSYDDGGLDERVDESLFDNACKKFNKAFEWYNAGDCVAEMDLSKELEQFYKDSNLLEDKCLTK